MGDYYATMANHVVEEYFNDTKIYIVYKVRKWVTKSCIFLFLLQRHNVCPNDTSI